MTIACARRFSDLSPASQALTWWLLGHGYNQHTAEDIIGRVEESGELAGSVLAGLLDPADEEMATAAYIDAMGEVPADHPNWDDETVCLDAAMLADGTHPLPFLEPASPDEDPACYFPGRPSLADRLAAAALEDLEIMPISGGGFEPSEEDAQWWAQQTDEVPQLEPSDRDYDAMYRDQFGDHCSPCGSWD